MNDGNIEWQERKEVKYGTQMVSPRHSPQLVRYPFKMGLLYNDGSYFLSSFHVI